MVRGYYLGQGNSAAWRDRCREKSWRIHRTNPLLLISTFPVCMHLPLHIANVGQDASHVRLSRPFAQHTRQADC